MIKLAKLCVIGVVLWVTAMCSQAVELEGEVCWLDSTYRVMMQEKGQPLKLDTFVKSLYDAVQTAKDVAEVQKLYKIVSNNGRTDIMQLYTYEKPRVYVGRIEITTEIRCKCKTNCDG